MTGRRTRLRLVLTIASLLAVGAAAPVGATERTRWDTRVLALVQSPGFPANVYVHPNGKVYAGTFTNPAGDQVSSKIREWTRDGTLLRTWTVPGQDTAHPHGVQVATSDAGGRLVVLDRTSGRVLRLDVLTGAFTSYSRLTDLPTCPSPGICSPNLVDKAPVPNFAAWGPKGELYVSDFGQAVIWRVPPGGGVAEPWFTSRELDGVELGTTGLVLAPDRRSLLVMQQSSLGLGELSVATGKLYRLPLGADRSLTRLWESRPLDLPDGFGLAASGRVYLACAGSNQLVVLDANYREVERTPGLPLTGDNGSSIPFDTPSNTTFAGNSVLVANQSFLGDGSHHAILDVHVSEPGLPVFIPATAGR